LSAVDQLVDFLVELAVACLFGKLDVGLEIVGLPALRL
jgi:hypothetical protein